MIAQKSIVRRIAVLFFLTLLSQQSFGYTGPFCPFLFQPSNSASLRGSLPAFRQDANGKCGPTSLGIALGYFGKVVPQTWDPYEIANRMTNATLQVAKATMTPLKLQVSMSVLANIGIPVVESAIYSVAINGADVLAQTARLFGTYAHDTQATLPQIIEYVANNEAVMIHWWSGPGPADDHWSVVQQIGPGAIELRDPWPTSPAANIKSLDDFLKRSKTAAPGVFTIVRISDRPLM